MSMRIAVASGRHYRCEHRYVVGGASAPGNGRHQRRLRAGHDRREDATSAVSISILEEDRAIRYPVGVGKAGKQWQGRAEIDGKHIQPAWSPPDDVLRDNPRLPPVYPGGSPANPMGPRALTLSGGEGYAIHGTNMPGSVGGFVSYGCIRMLNADITDLYQTRAGRHAR